MLDLIAYAALTLSAIVFAPLVVALAAVDPAALAGLLAITLGGWLMADAVLGPGGGGA